MKNDFEGVAPVDEMLAQARALYREIAVELRSAMLAARDRLPEGSAIDDVTWLARKHQDNLRAVLKMEADLAGQSVTFDSPLAGSELDLEDARREIRQRLTRLAAAGGNG